MNEVEIDANDFANSLLEQVVALSRDLAFAKAQLVALQKQLDAGKENDGS